MTERIPTEHEEQREFVRWFRQTFPDVKILAIPNGSFRTKSTAVRLRAEGVLAGIPDLFVPEWALWIEMKRTKGGRLSEDQKTTIKYLRGCGYGCIVALGAEDGRNQIMKAINEKQHPSSFRLSEGLRSQASR